MQQRQPNINNNAVLIRADQQKKKTVSNNALIYKMVSPEGSPSLEMYRVTAPPNQSTGPKALQHGGDENFLVLSGKIEVEVEDQKYVLNAGDSVFIPRGQHHRVTNIGSETGECIFVLSPPKY